MASTDTALLISLADYERAAEAAMDPGARDYAVGGAGDEITLRDNVAAWSRLAGYRMARSRSCPPLEF